jgi:hypothetical protein
MSQKPSTSSVSSIPLAPPPKKKKWLTGYRRDNTIEKIIKEEEAEGDSNTDR